MVEFAGYRMPIHYGSQMEEHRCVRLFAGKFDVSHMGVVDIHGTDAGSFLSRTCVGDMQRLPREGSARYTLLLNRSGCILDDLIVYRMENGFRAIVNAGVKHSDVEWLNSHIGDSDVRLQLRDDTCIVAIQGPEAIGLTCRALDLDLQDRLEPFNFEVVSDELMVARTGYTGEEGLELVCSSRTAPEIWDRLGSVEVPSIGLGARDTLRLEAGLSLNGQDMTPCVMPFAANLAWTIDWDPPDRGFIGRNALEDARASGIDQKLTGLILEERGVLREGYEVSTKDGPGVVTSGTMSPTLGYSIALARLPRAATGECEVSIRGRRLPARIVRPPFVRNGKKVHK